MVRDIHSELRELLPFEEMTEGSFEKLVAMASESNRRSGRWRRMIETIKAWEDAMDCPPCDCALDRIRDLERQVVLLNDAVRQASGKTSLTEPVRGVGQISSKL